VAVSRASVIFLALIIFVAGYQLLRGATRQQFMLSACVLMCLHFTGCYSPIVLSIPDRRWLARGRILIRSLSSVIPTAFQTSHDR